MQKEFFTCSVSPALSQQGTNPLSCVIMFCHLILCGQYSHKNWSNDVHVPRNGPKYVLAYREVGKKNKVFWEVMGQCSVLQSHMLWLAISNTIGFVVM